MRKYLLFPLVLAAIPLYAQHKVCYQYDSSGNRIRRSPQVQVRRSPKSAPASQNTFRIGDGSDEKVTFAITDGKLRVNVPIKEKDISSIAVYAVSGIQVYSCSEAKSQYVVDLSNRPNGVYLVQLSFNGKSTTFKVVKK